MYVPPMFAARSQTQIFEMVDVHPFATVCSQAEGAVQASHLPLLLHEKEGAHGCLYGHFAGANAHSRVLEGEKLAVFHGPHAYVSPLWYRKPNTVPTWNYVAVHARGRCVALNREETVAHLAELARRFEGESDGAWRMPWPDEFMEKLVGMVVAFRIEVASWEGKWKLSQNHGAEKCRNVAAALRATGGHESARVAALMEAEIARMQ